MVLNQSNLRVQRRHPVLQRGVPAAADRQRRGGGEEVQAVRGGDEGAAAAAAERAQSACLGSVEASTDPMSHIATKY